MAGWRDNSVDLATIAIAATPAFLASAVEFVEATTIVLAVGITRGWRAPLVGSALSALTLALVCGTRGVAGVTVVPEHLLLGIVGTLLLLFGLRWLRKAVLRFAGIVALHDEEEIYRLEVAELRAQGVARDRWDWIGMIVAYKAVLLEGTEVAFVAIAITWVIAHSGADIISENSGWVLLGLVLALVLANLYRAGRNARRRIG